MSEPRSTKPKVLMVGALPPPAIGPYMAMNRLVNSHVLNEAIDLDFLDISDRRPPTNIGKFDFQNLTLGIHHAVACTKKLLTEKHQVFYLGISQGTWGYLRDLSLILPAMILRRAVVLHLRGSEFRTFYENHMPRWMRPVTRAVLRRTSRMIILGESLKSIFSGLIPDDRLVSIPNGINWEEFARPEDQPAPDPSSILYLSSLMRRKGLFVLINALPAVLEQHPQAHLTVAGLWQSETEEREANETIDRLGIASKITFVGEVRGDEKNRLLHEHAVLAFPPVEPEGLPWVILEAMSASMPVITTAQGAIPDVVEESTTGFIVAPESTSVAEALCQLLDDPNEAVRMGQRGLARVEAHFSEDVYVAELLKLFLKVASEQKQAN